MKKRFLVTLKILILSWIGFSLFSYIAVNFIVSKDIFHENKPFFIKVSMLLGGYVACLFTLIKVASIILNKNVNKTSL